MTEYGALLEREMQRIPPASFSLDDLHRRRERRQRNQRLAAGAVALVVFGASAAGLGWALMRAETPLPRPAASPVPTFTSEDLEVIVLAPDEAPGETRHQATLTGQRALEGPLNEDESGRLTVEELAGPGTGFVDGRTMEFLKGLKGLPDSMFFGSVAVLYDDPESAARALRLLVGDFRDRDERATQEAAPSLGEDAVVVRGALLGGEPATPDVVYLWRIGNLVLIAAGSPGLPGEGAGIPGEVRSIAELMNSRASDAVALAHKESRA